MHDLWKQSRGELKKLSAVHFVNLIIEPLAMSTSCTLSKGNSLRSCLCEFTDHTESLMGLGETLCDAGLTNGGLKVHHHMTSVCTSSACKEECVFMCVRTFVSISV